VGENSKIEWCDNSWNPWVGCTAVSPGCDNCYARAQVTRYGQDFATLRRTSKANWRKPLKWNRDAEVVGDRPKVFCGSWCDVFDNQAPQEWRTDVFDLIDATPHLDWLLLTKRPQNIAKLMPPFFWEIGETGSARANVWIGTTVENQAEADRRIPHLLAVPAVVRFLSCEPLLGRIDLAGTIRRAVLSGGITKGSSPKHPISGVIAGGESGPNRRRVNLDHMRALRDQCAAAGVPFFGKQDDKKHDLPPDLRIRQFPEVKHHG
jgi:protein gp37